MSSKPAGLSSPPTTTPGRTAAGPPPRLRKPIPSAFARALPRRVSEPTPRLFDGAATSPGPHAKARRWPQERRSPCLLGGRRPARRSPTTGPAKGLLGRVGQGGKIPPQFRRRENLVGGRGSTARGPKFGPPPPLWTGTRPDGVGLFTSRPLGGGRRAPAHRRPPPLETYLDT